MPDVHPASSRPQLTADGAGLTLHVPGVGHVHHDDAHWRVILAAWRREGILTLCGQDAGDRPRDSGAGAALETVNTTTTLTLRAPGARSGVTVTGAARTDLLDELDTRLTLRAAQGVNVGTRIHEWNVVAAALLLSPPGRVRAVVLDRGRPTPVPVVDTLQGTALHLRAPVAQLRPAETWRGHTAARYNGHMLTLHGRGHHFVVAVAWPGPLTVGARSIESRGTHRVLQVILEGA